jgi:hypothetical protein
MPLDNLFGVLYCSYLESFLVDPKQYGDTYASRRRRAGMQTQKIPVKASRTDQYAVGTLSYVGFVEDENWTRDCRRMMEIRVVLELWSVSILQKTSIGRCLQEPDAEHHDDLDLLLQAHRESQQFWYRDRDDYQVQCDIDPGMRPCKHMEVDALPCVFSIPVLPDVRYRRTIEDTGERECETVCQRKSRKCVNSRP